MEVALSVLIGVLLGTAIYFMLGTNFMRFTFGLLVMGNAINLLIFVMGRFNRGMAPIVPKDLQVPDITLVNSLPQALILTAIVIGFALLSYAMVLVYCLESEFSTIDPDEIIEAGEAMQLENTFESKKQG